MTRAYKNTTMKWVVNLTKNTASGKNRSGVFAYLLDTGGVCGMGGDEAFRKVQCPSVLIRQKLDCELSRSGNFS